MLIKLFSRIVKNVWPMLFIFSVIIVSIRLIYLLYNHKKIVLYKEVANFCFVIYILLLYYIVTFQDINYGTNNFIPFKEIFRYQIGSRLFFRNVLGNIALFLPFGIFVSHYIETKSFFPTLFVTLITSIAIEFTQMSIGRTGDVDDVILNVLGGTLGYFVYKYSKRVINKMPKFTSAETLLNIVSIIIFGLLIYISIKYNFWRLFR